MRRCRRRGAFLLVSGFVCLALIIYVVNLARNVDQYHKCIQHSEELCRLYTSGTIVGNLCSDICRKNHYIVTCLQIPDPNGKWVLRYHSPGNSSSFILKTVQRDDAQFLSDQYNYWRNSHFLDSVEAARSEMTKVFQGVNTTINTNQAELFLEYISMRSETVNVSVIAGLKLVDQPEFVALFQYQGLPFVPKVYGTCGEHYAMEELLPTDTMTGSLSTRYQLAHSYLDLVEKMEFNSVNSVQLCDVKPSNYGIRRETGELVVLDIDTLFFKDDLTKELEATKFCTQDSDCDFWDCTGVCDKESQKCLRVQANNNLQDLWMIRSQSISTIMDTCYDVLQKFAVLNFRAMVPDPFTSHEQLRLMDMILDIEKICKAVCRKIFIRSLQRGQLGLLSQPLFTLQPSTKLSKLLVDCVNNHVTSAGTLRDHVSNLRSAIKETPV